MTHTNTKSRCVLPVLLLLAAAPGTASCGETPAGLYWFVPDGMRADLGGKDVFELAAEGKYPNIRKMMENGAYGYSVPVYPSHTPVNFATLMTGCYPELHGVSDGPMRLEGYALAKPSVSGFSSTAKKVPPAWKIFEDADRTVAVVSVPGSTPPEMSSGMTIRGRWGSWGSDFWAVNYEASRGARPRAGNSTRLFFMGPRLTQQVKTVPAQGWKNAPVSYSPPLEAELTAYGTTVYACVYDNTDDKAENYSGVLFSFDKNSPLADFDKPDSWSGWVPVSLKWGTEELESSLKVSLIRLEPSGFMKARLLFDPMNRTTVQPSDAVPGMEKELGPMVDFPDNWPAQLNNYPEEKAVFLSEAKLALDWHRSLVPFMYSTLKPDIFIHDTYTPNQMLESRWWLPYADKNSSRYAAATPEERASALAALEEMYGRLDAILGEAIKNAGKDSLIALSSDHGIAPLNRHVMLNNLFAGEGLLKFSADPVTGVPAIAWADTRVAHLKMIGVYLRPDKLAGPWKRGSGPQYEALREKVKGLLLDLKDGEISPVERVVNWEDAGELRMPKDGIPDLLLVMKPGYGLTEEMSAGLDVFRDSVEGGHKQALLADKNPALWTPFIVMGPGVKKGYRLKSNISNADQFPTLLKLLGMPVPEYMQGKVITELCK
ncbi:MAG: alkaline phosphatase family protein [Elusimicrobia bacterium]|nr:alkaline phosphatase family protein [Elusimicrobiota bacterium]